MWLNLGVSSGIDIGLVVRITQRMITNEKTSTASVISRVDFSGLIGSTKAVLLFVFVLKMVCYEEATASTRTGTTREGDRDLQDNISLDLSHAVEDLHVSKQTKQTQRSYQYTGSR
jgi:hypothetical protein